MTYSRKEWESGLREDLTRELNRLCGIPIEQLMGGPRSGLLEVVKNAMGKRLAEAIERYDEAETITDPETVAPAEAPKEKKSALDEAKDDADKKDEHGGSKPPEDGLCRECRQPRKLNRLKLCYPCFVELVLTDEAKKRNYEWKSGDKHPDWCSCEGIGEHPERDHGAWRGN